jgi:ABC-type phosphate transport system substrate-binding protein
MSAGPFSPSSALWGKNVRKVRLPRLMSTARGTRARPMAAAAAALTALCAGILAPAQPAAAASLVPIAGAGSTWAYPAIHQWVASASQSGITVNYIPNGSASGRTSFKEGVAGWAQSEIPYGVQDGGNFDPPPARGYAYLPDLAGATTFMYNLHIGGQRVTNLRLSGTVIAGIFTNLITMWNDPRIAADNPGLTLPATPITPVVRSDAGGATWQFTQWMLATQGSAWRAYCAVVGRSPCTATSAYPVQPGTAMVGVPGDSGVTGYVAQAAAEGAIGYTEYSYAAAAGFPVAKMLNAAGYVAVTTTSFAAAGPETLSAVFTPAGNFTGSTIALILTVQPPPSYGTIPLAVTAPVTGAFTLTVDTIDTVTLTMSGNNATAATVLAPPRSAPT